MKRCGVCGTFIAENDTDLEDIKNLELNKHENNKEIELTYCDSCLYEEERYIEITREMAIDAEDRSLEGQIIKW